MSEFPLPSLVASVSPSLRRAFEPKKYFSYRRFLIEYRFFYAQTKTWTIFTFKVIKIEVFALKL